MEQNRGQPHPGASALIPLATGPLFGDELLVQLRGGNRCVRFEFCVSFGVATLRHQSAVHLTTSWQDRYIRGAGYSLLALLLGPWGVPWGVVWTVRAVWVNLTGGEDVTDEVIRQLSHEPPTQPIPQGA